MSIFDQQDEQMTLHDIADHIEIDTWADIGVQHMIIKKIVQKALQDSNPSDFRKFIYDYMCDLFGTMFVSIIYTPVSSRMRDKEGYSVAVYAETFVTNRPDGVIHINMRFFLQTEQQALYIRDLFTQIRSETY